MPSAPVDKTLDFLVVGAQKSGTTAIYEYLRRHPAIAMPAGKEAAFFSEEEYFRRGFESFRKDCFSGARGDQVWGKITPQYMSNEAIADRIAQCLPNARIIAILRDPIERAISHYKMVLRRGYDRRPIDTAFFALLQPAALVTARRLAPGPDSEAHCCLAWSEYGRILGYYRNRYSRDRILVLFTDDLAGDPGKTIDHILTFIGLAPGYRPSNLGERVYVGASTLRFPWLRPILQRVGAKAALRHLPAPVRGQLRLAFRYFNERPGRREADPVVLSDGLQRMLVEFYRDDVALLEQGFDIKVPWARFGAWEKPPT